MHILRGINFLERERPQQRWLTLKIINDLSDLNLLKLPFRNDNFNEKN
jgi:hypothetical protein